MWIGITKVSIPFACGTVRVLPVFQFSRTLGGVEGVAGTGINSMGIPLPHNPNLVGGTCHMQAIYMHAGATKGISMTNGLETKVG